MQTLGWTVLRPLVQYNVDSTEDLQYNVDSTEELYASIMWTVLRPLVQYNVDGTEDLQYGRGPLFPSPRSSGERLRKSSSLSCIRYGELMT